MEIIRESKREWENIRESEKIDYLIKDKIRDKKLYLKNSEPPIEFQMGDADETGILFYCSDDSPLIVVGKTISLYITINRQIEIDFEIVRKADSGSVVLKALEARIGKSGRIHPRVINTEDTLIASNFQISKSKKIIDNKKPQVANKVIFSEFERQLAEEYPGIKIYDFADRNRPQETKYLDNSEKGLLVTDTTEFEAYKPQDSDFFDYFSYLVGERSLESIKIHYQDKKINSLMAIPLIYEMANERIPIGYIYCEGHGEYKITMNAFEKGREKAQEIIKRILDANTLTIKEKQKVLNISQGGVSLGIDNPDLIQYLPDQDWLTFDLIFKLQPPIRFHGKLIHLSKNSGSYTAGLDIAGSAHSDLTKSAAERLESLIQLVIQKAG